MNTAPFVIEQVYDVPASSVWQAITDKQKMKEWYFDVDDFKAEVGFAFSFTGGSKDRQYVHLCRVTEVIPERKLAYSWRYMDYPGDSEVTFELFPEGDKTRLRLTHAGLHTFPQDSKDFARSSFQQGWTHIVCTSLQKFLAGHEG